MIEIAIEKSTQNESNKRDGRNILHLKPSFISARGPAQVATVEVLSEGNRVLHSYVLTQSGATGKLSLVPTGKQVLPAYETGDVVETEEEA